MENKVWVRYEKRVHGHPSETYFLFDKDKYDDKKTLEYYFENEWPNKLRGGENAGYSHECEIVDAPPVEWLEKAYVRTSIEILETQKYAEFLSEELLRAK